MYCNAKNINQEVSELVLYKIQQIEHSSVILTISTIVISGGSKGGARDASPPRSKFFQFHAFFGKIWQNRMLAPLLGEILDPPLVIAFLSILCAVFF